MASYESDLIQCSCFLHQQGACGWQSVSLEGISSWISSLTSDGYAVASLARKLSALRMLARYLVAEGKLQNDFTELLCSPKRGRFLPHALSIEEMERFLSGPDLNTALGKRDRAIFEVMYGSGLRVSEVSSVLVNAVDLDEGFARIFGKGAKERIVPVGGEAIRAIRNYLHGGRPQLTKDGSGGELFLSKRGTPISRKMIWVLVKDYARKAGIEKTSPLMDSDIPLPRISSWEEPMFGQFRRCWDMRMSVPPKSTPMWNPSVYGKSMRTFILWPRIPKWGYFKQIFVEMSGSAIHSVYTMNFTFSSVRKSVLPILIMSLLGLFFQGCGQADEFNKLAEPSSEGTAIKDLYEPLYGEADPIALGNAQSGGTFTTWGGSFPKSLNMFLDYNAFSANVMGLLYEPLISLHSTENRPVGVLAESWEIAEDKMTFTFKIRDEATWSDGRPITSKDIQFYYDVMLDPKNLTSLFRVSLKRFERPVAVDDKTVLIKANTKHWNNFFGAGKMVALPSHIWTGQDFNKINFEFPVVSGPYQLGDVKKGRSISLQRRNDWWGRTNRYNSGKYNFNKVVYRSMTDRNKALEAFKKGVFDAYPIYTSSIWMKKTGFDQVEKGWVIRQTVYNQKPKGYQGLAINLRNPKFEDIRVRQALGYLLNREAMNEKFMYNQYFLLNSFLS